MSNTQGSERNQIIFQKHAKNAIFQWVYIDSFVKNRIKIKNVPISVFFI